MAASRFVCRTPRSSRLRCYEFFRRTPIFLSTGVRGCTCGTGSAVGGGRVLAAASEAARDDALSFFCSSAHTCAL